MLTGRISSGSKEDSETCRMILEVLLDRPIPEVSVRAEHSLLFASDCRSIRLDIYASDKMQVEYNLEMQNQPDSLAKRSRYHQSEMDVFSLKLGEDFDKLQPGYVIFICTFDPFARGLYRYTFENRCLEDDFPLEDGTQKIFLNTKGINGDEVPEERYMRFDELMKYAEQEGFKAGQEAGREIGQNRILSLIERMLADGQEAMLSRLQEPAVLEEMLKRYQI